MIGSYRQRSAPVWNCDSVPSCNCDSVPWRLRVPSHCQYWVSVPDRLVPLPTCGRWGLAGVSDSSLCSSRAAPWWQSTCHTFADLSKMWL